MDFLGVAFFVPRPPPFPVRLREKPRTRQSPPRRNRQFSTVNLKEMN